MWSMRFEIRHRYRPLERLAVDQPRALVGSAAHCEIRIPPEDCAPEALLLEQRDGQLFVKPLAESPIPMLGGRPLLHGPLPSGSNVELGTCVLTVSLVDPTGGISKKQRTSPRVFMLGALFVAAAAYAATHQLEEDVGFALPDKVPSLWATQANNCPQSEPALALAHAFELKSIADSKRQRSPFVPRDGVAAVAVYRDAVACFRAAGSPGEALNAEQDMTRLKMTVDEDYHLTRLRLERALLVPDPDNALIQISVLRSMLSNQTGAYTTSLANLERRLLVVSGRIGAKS